jgi:hypothetical protein
MYFHVPPKQLSEERHFIHFKVKKVKFKVVKGCAQVMTA